MIWKVLIFAIVAYVLFRLFANDRKKREDKIQQKEAQEEAQKVEDGNLVRDPICGTYVEKESSISVRDGEHVEHFCSHDCRDKYINRLEEQEKISQ